MHASPATLERVRAKRAALGSAAALALQAHSSAPAPPPKRRTQDADQVDRSPPGRQPRRREAPQQKKQEDRSGTQGDRRLARLGDSDGERARRGAGKTRSRAAGPVGVSVAPPPWVADRAKALLNRYIAASVAESSNPTRHNASVPASVAAEDPLTASTLASVSYPRVVPEAYVHASPNAVEGSHDVLTAAMSHGAPTHRNGHDVRDGVIVETGNELLCEVSIPPAIGGATSTVSAGGILACVPVNPRFIDGCRVSKILEMYDQWRVEHMEFGYEPIANAFTAGQLIIAFINQFSDGILYESGFQAARDAYSRSGMCMFQVTQQVKAKIAHPLLKWYYTATSEDADLEMPGFIVVITTQAMSNATAVSTPLGTISMHYQIALRSPSIEGASSQVFAAQSATLNLTAASGGLGTPIQVSAASSGLAANQRLKGTVYWGTVVSADDTTGTVWRTWLDSQTADQVVVSPGNIIVWVVTVDGVGVDRLLFYPSLDAAISADNFGAGPIFQGSAAMPAGTKGFKLWNVMGCNIEGSGE